MMIERLYFKAEKLAEPGSSFLLRQEFLYYFIHITRRLAFLEGFSPGEREDLSAILFKVLDAAMAELPESMRAECLELSLREANEAEIDYAGSKEVYPKNDPLAEGDSVYSKLARKIIEKLGRNHNSEIAFQIITATSEQLRQANVPNLLKEIRPNLHKYAEVARSVSMSEADRVEFARGFRVSKI